MDLVEMNVHSQTMQKSGPSISHRLTGHGVSVAVSGCVQGSASRSNDTKASLYGCCPTTREQSVFISPQASCSTLYRPRPARSAERIFLRRDMSPHCDPKLSTGPLLHAYREGR